MVEDEPQHLLVLIANERPDRLELLAQVVTHLGHEVIAREIEVKEVGAVTEREHPDVVSGVASGRRGSGSGLLPAWWLAGIVARSEHESRRGRGSTRWQRHRVWW
jgi:hypothetical protein